MIWLHVSTYLSLVKTDKISCQNIHGWRNVNSYLVFQGLLIFIIVVTQNERLKEKVNLQKMTQVKFQAWFEWIKDRFFVYVIMFLLYRFKCRKTFNYFVLIAEGKSCIQDKIMSFSCLQRKRKTTLQLFWLYFFRFCCCKKNPSSSSCSYTILIATLPT